MLGSRFDLRAVHASILKNGAMPGWMLEHNVDAWIGQQPAGSTPKWQNSAAD
ncbi:MAG TPA: hypothetical protein VHE09_12495 [Rhizomicrobium sp.]|nr:hypothetical protein [Rhizomicrobium sp.]